MPNARNFKGWPLAISSAAPSECPIKPAMPAPQPKVSILIPNFNNGRSSSKDGKRDFLGDLLRSLQETLGDDPTPFEVILYDDGSTDDSLETARAWAQKQWPNGRPFLDLIEAAHCGFLSRTANVLCRRARGEILVRLDGDIVCLTPRWVQAICQVFEYGHPRLGIVGPKQLGANGRIHALGDWLLHPNGYIHVAAGMERYAVRWPIEVDHVMGCFHCMKRAVYDDVGGYDENFLRGQTEDLGLRARLKGWTALAVPHVEFVHYHHLRKNRETLADSSEGVAKGLKTFEDKWGFSRLAPDLDEVRRRYAGTPLLWNARWFGAPGSVPVFGSGKTGTDPFASRGEDQTPPAATLIEPADIDAQPCRFEDSDWSRFTQDPETRGLIEFRFRVAMEVVRQVGTPKQAVHVACGSGLIAHLLAMQGVPVLGVDRRRRQIQLARQVTGSRQYPGSAVSASSGGGGPRFEHQTHARTLPVADASADLVLICDELERHPNPVSLLREAKRILIPGKHLVIVSQRKRAGEDSPTDPEHRYLYSELLTQIRATGFMPLVDPRTDDPKRDMFLVATVPPPVVPSAAVQAAAPGLPGQNTAGSSEREPSKAAQPLPSTAAATSQ
jgi:glycosyltransferase involved in cell wall biosynthesis/ubiquinone/menaquinone biosynthesis C-methylase UbiE